MLTGDAPFTALHVARSVGISSPSGQALLLTRRCEDGDFYWKPVPAGAVMGEEMGTIPFSVVGVGELRKKGFELLVMGDTWSELTAAKEDAWKMAGLVSVFARMSPEGKEQVCCRTLHLPGNGLFLLSTLNSAPRSASMHS